jgi:CBS domain containing-hemolysin-like protein
VSKSDPSASRKQKHELVKWVITIFLTTIVVSGLISLISDELMDRSSLAVAFVILLVIILIGIVFDIIGVAVASADEKPFHSMAARKVPGAQDAIKLLRNAERVSSICNDVVGDICGVVSGCASATIAAQVLAHFSFGWPQLASLVMSALVAGLTVGGKAIGKTFAMNSCTNIISFVGKFLFYLHHPGKMFAKKKKK